MAVPKGATATGTPYERPRRGGMGARIGVAHHGRGVQRGPYFSGGPRGGPNYGNRGGSGGALRSGVPSVVSEWGVRRRLPAQLEARES